MTAPRLIALDLDGTLLTHGKLISDRNARAVRHAVERGVAVTLASGRMHEATVRYAKLLDLAADTPIISYNGALVRTVAGETLRECPVAADLATQLIDYTAETGLHLNFYHEDTLYVRSMDKWSDIYLSRTGSQPVVTDFDRLRGCAPTKLIIIDTLDITNALVAPMKERFGDALYITKTDNEYLEFMDPAADKGSALAVVAARLGIAQADTAAFGDNFNDLPMLAWAGRGIAMANARDEVKAAVTEFAADSELDGVAQWIESHIA